MPTGWTTARGSGANCRPCGPVQGRMTAWLDVRYALRMWMKHRTFTVAAISTIAIAIAANIAIFAVVDGVLLKPLHLPHPERIVRIEERHHGRRLNLTGATFVDLRERTRLLEGVAA